MISYNLPTSNMENRLGYSVLRNFDYSQPFEVGVANRGRKEHESAHILSKTCLDLFLPSSGNRISTVESKTVSDDFVNDGRKEGPSLDSGGTLSGNIVVKSKMQKSQNSCNSTEDAEVESPVSSCNNEPITTQKEGTISDKNVRKRDANGEIRGKRPRPPPLVVFAYGGGWRRGDKQTWRHYMSRWECNFSLAAMVGRDRLYSNIGESFASRGFPCAILSYPIAPTPWLIHLIEMAISLSYALFYWMLAALLLFIVLEGLPISCGSLASHLRVPVMSLMAGLIIVAQWITLAIMISRELYLERRHQSGTKKKNISSKMPIVVALLASITTVSTLDIYTLAENNILGLSISGILVFAVQCLIFYFRQTTTFDLGPSLVAGPQVQAECVTLALRWLVDYGQSTGHFDPESIILVGHSAGGHLVSLVALDHHYLTDVGISPTVIKGVISLSAVHDLLSISKGFNYHIYLKPAFGTDPTYWTSMSPIEYVKLLDEKKNPTPTISQSLSLQPLSSFSSKSSEEESPTSSAAEASSSTSPLILPTSSASSSTAKTALSSSSMPSSPPQTLSPPLLPTSPSTSHLPVKSSPPSPSPSQIKVTSSPSSAMTQTQSAPHRPHFLIISPAQDFAFMIKDGDKMCSVLSKNGYTTQRRWMKGCGHFNMVRKFGCPWYRYWTGVLQKKGGWVPCDGELFCWEFVQQFWNKDENFSHP